MKGKKYDISEAETVSELQMKVKEASGVAPESQGRLLFGGKRLDSSTALSEAGVVDGSQLNFVPGSTKKKSSSAASSVPPSASASTSTASSAEATDPMREYLKKAGVDSSQLDEMMKNLGGDSDGSVPSMEESLGAMSEMMQSPIFQEYLSDPEKLEQSRQMILNNPMLKQMMGSMPGMEELLNDKDAWREAMLAAANLYKNMDGEQLKQMMSGLGQNTMPGMGGMMGGPPPGMFDGAFDNSAAARALDELDEDD